MTSSLSDKKSNPKIPEKRRPARNGYDRVIKDDKSAKKKTFSTEKGKEDNIQDEVTKKKKTKSSSFSKAQVSKWEAARRQRFNDVLESLRLELPNSEPCPKIEIAQRALAFVKAHKNPSKDKDYEAHEDINRVEKENAILTYILKEAKVTVKFNKKQVIYVISKCSSNCKPEKKKYVLNFLSAHSQKCRNYSSDDSTEKVTSQSEGNASKRDVVKEHIIVENEDGKGSTTVNIVSKVEGGKEVESSSSVASDPEPSSNKISIVKAPKVHVLDNYPNQTIYVHDIRPTVVQQPKSVVLPAANKMILVKYKNKDNMMLGGTANFLVPSVTEPHLTFVTPSLSNSPIMSTGLAVSPKKTIIQVDPRYPFVINSASSNTSVPRLKKIAPKPVAQEIKRDSIDFKASFAKRRNLCAKVSPKLQYKRKSNEDILIPQCNRNDEKEDEDIQGSLTDQIQNPMVNDIDGELENMMDLSEDMPCVIQESMKGSEVTEEGIVEMLRSMNEENEQTCCDTATLPSSENLSKAVDESNKSLESEKSEVHTKENSNECTEKSDDNHAEQPSCFSGVESSVGNSNYSIMSLCISSKLNNEVSGKRPVVKEKSSNSFVNKNTNLKAREETPAAVVSSSSETLITKVNDSSDKNVPGICNKALPLSTVCSVDSNRHNTLKTDLSVSALISNPVLHPENLGLKGLDNGTLLPELPTTSSASLVPPTIFLHPPSFPTPPIPPLPLPPLSLSGLPTTLPSSTYSFSLSAGNGSGLNNKQSSISNENIKATSTVTFTTATTLSNNSCRSSNNKSCSDITVSSSANTKSSNHSKVILDTVSNNVTASLTSNESGLEKQKSSEIRVSSSEVVSDCKSKLTYSNSVSVDQSHKLPVPFPLSTVPPSLPLLTTSATESAHITKSILSLTPSISSYAHPFPFCALALSDAPTTFSFTLTKTTSSTSSSQSQSSSTVAFVSKPYLSDYSKSVSETSVSSVSDTILSSSVFTPSTSCKSSYPSSLSLSSSSNSKVCTSLPSTFSSSLCSNFAPSSSSISPLISQSVSSRPNEFDNQMSVASLVASTAVFNDNNIENDISTDNTEEALSSKANSDKEHFLSKTNSSEKSNDSLEFKLPLLPLSTYMDSQGSKAISIKHNPDISLLKSANSNKDDSLPTVNSNRSSCSQPNAEETLYNFKYSQLTRNFNGETSSSENVPKSLSTLEEPQNKAVDSLYIGTSGLSQMESNNKETSLNLNTLNCLPNSVKVSKPDSVSKINTTATDEKFKEQTSEDNAAKKNTCQTVSHVFVNNNTNEFCNFTPTSVNRIMVSSASFSDDLNEDNSSNSYLSSSVSSSKDKGPSKATKGLCESHSKDVSNLLESSDAVSVKHSSSNNILNKNTVDYADLYSKRRKIVEERELPTSDASLSNVTVKESENVFEQIEFRKVSIEKVSSTKICEKTDLMETLSNKESQQISGIETFETSNKDCFQSACTRKK
ncbi:hypothetical protein Anas_09718 [Armadillidium nasatum]|uniref:BHLH domain-containing protein n=1 Tax=Armadillidium nasatum TaxID=96803 RepID=A0A5N5T8S6_9CRUS|nr:hypothetical protein Anas_09718 [Armadillidium nasatum]